MTSLVYTPIMVALLAALQARCGDTFKTYSRLFVSWENMKLRAKEPGGRAIKQPALYLFEGVGLGGGVHTHVQAGRTPDQRTITVSLVIYAKQPGAGRPGGANDQTPGADVLYELVEAIESALSPAQNSFAVEQLGGRVHRAWIEGDVHFLVGDIDPDGQGMAVVPVRILVP